MKGCDEASFVDRRRALDISIIAAVNNEAVLEQNLKRSPLIADGDASLFLYRNCHSMSEAYNTGLSEAESEYLAFVHQDVYLPRSWENNLAKAVAYLDQCDPTWAVVGVYGVQETGQHIGTVWSSGLGRVLHEGPEAPQPVISLDELAFVVRRSSGIRFDPSLPNFHLYGTDVCLAARAVGRMAYAAHMPVIHNSQPAILGGAYLELYRYMQRKWWRDLPVATTVGPVTKSGLGLWYKLVRQQAAGFFSRHFLAHISPYRRGRAGKKAWLRTP